jgi:hypothetical protein
MKRIVLGLLVSCTVVTACAAKTKKKRNTREDNEASATSSVAAPPASPSLDIAGDYDIVGTNQNGSPYHGKLTIKSQGEVFQFHWMTGPIEYDGVGVALDRTIGVAFALGRDGKGCSVAHYKSTREGLSGRWGEWGVNRSGTETATRSDGAGIEGLYDVAGTMPSGKDYRGTMKVAADGAGFSFVWDDAEALQGFGLRLDDYVSVGIGTKTCGFVSYRVRPNGLLEGQWASFKTHAVGTEVAKRIPTER